MAGKKITSIEGLRFVLFIMIFLFHYGITSFSIGWGGVQAFLLISGFFLTNKLMSLSGSQININKLFLHRLKRLYPSYIALLIASILITFAIKHTLPVKSIIAQILCLQSLYSAYCGLHPGLYFVGHTWYLTLDIILFLIWILAFKFINRNFIRQFLLCSVIIAVLYRILCVMSGNFLWAYMNPIGQMDSFAIGSLLAYMYNSRGEIKKQNWIIPLLIGFAGILMCLTVSASINNLTLTDSYISYHSYTGYMLNPITANIFLFIALFFAGVFLLLLRDNRISNIFSNKYLVLLGSMSYTAYIFHLPIIAICQHLPIHKYISLLIALLTTLIVSYIWQMKTEPVIQRKLK